MLTSYDYTLPRLLDEAGIEMILVGDSASNIVCGNRYTLPITVEEMIFLTKGVVRAAEHALVVIDMPFGSYQVSEEQAVSNALKMMKESGADAVKLEGGEEILPAIRHMVQAGVPVMGHLLIPCTALVATNANTAAIAILSGIFRKHRSVNCSRRTITDH